MSYLISIESSLGISKESKFINIAEIVDFARI